MTRNELIQVLTHIQNTQHFWHVDIMTFAGFMASDDDLAGYVMQKFRQLPEASRAFIVRVTRHIAAEVTAPNTSMMEN